MNHKRGGFRTGYCPSCERYISTSRSCPYCDCDAYCPPALGLLRIGAALLATLGLLLLYIFSTTRPIPTVKIAKLFPMMNYAVVQLSGTLATKPYVARTTSGNVDYLAFTLENTDGHNVRVQAYKAVAHDLDTSGEPLITGRGYSAIGQLQVSADGTARLRLRRAEDLTPLITRDTAP
ncbi:MAG: hypothetical protein ISS35_03745 [Kiritimatiellae bacterium]|nr:hypothetical protein [Kiritimatiellia bacterium]